MSEIPIMDNSLCIRFDCFNFFQVWKQKKHLARFLLFYYPDTIWLFNPWKSVLDMTLSLFFSKNKCRSLKTP